MVYLNVQYMLTCITCIPHLVGLRVCFWSTTGGTTTGGTTTGVREIRIHCV